MGTGQGRFIRRMFHPRGGLDLKGELLRIKTLKVSLSSAQEMMRESAEK